MEFTTRAFSAPDLPDCLAIEQAAVRSNHYLADVLDYYTTTRGEFTVVWCRRQTGRHRAS